MGDFKSKEYQDNHRNEDCFPVIFLAHMSVTANSQEGAEDLVNSHSEDFNDLNIIDVGDNPLLKIDYKKLKEQKNDLLVIKETIEPTSELHSSIGGVINLLDSIQDYAVDVLGKAEKEVFNIILT